MTVRRSFLLERGEPLLVPRDPLRSLANHVATANLTGLPQALLVASRMSEVPVPVDGGRDGDRRVAGVRAEAMWWPLLWLPERLTRRVDYQVVDGDVWVVDPDGLFEGDSRSVPQPISGVPVRHETTDVWVVRVLMEVEAVGLYDPDSGTWGDVLSEIGLDVDDQDDVARVSAWLGGYHDSDLDYLNTQFLCDGGHVPDGESPTWAFRAAIATYPDLLDAAWTYGSDTMRAVIEDVAHGVSVGEISETGETRFMARLVCQMSGSLLQWYTDSESEWWAQMLAVVDAFDGTAEQMVGGPLAQIDRRLEDVQRVVRARMETAIERYRA